MTALPAPLPILPTALLRRYGYAEQTDTRFRVVARLRQSIWGELQGKTCGRYRDAPRAAPALLAAISATALVGPESTWSPDPDFAHPAPTRMPRGWHGHQSRCELIHTKRPTVPC